MSNSVAYLYMIICKKDKKKYIGVTNNPIRRWEEHKELAANPEEKKHLYVSMRENGLDSFEFFVLCSGSRSWVETIEKSMISYLDTRHPKGFNIHPGGKIRRRRKVTKKK